MSKSKTINTTKAPSLPYPNWTVEEHQENGEIDISKIELYYSENQKNGKYIEGNELRREIKNPLNASVLDYLLAHPKLIPEEWKGKCIYFWGTVYRHSDGSLSVRCLCFEGGEWQSVCLWLDYDWRGCGPAACSASPQSSDTRTSLDPYAFELTADKRITELEQKVAKLCKIINVD